MNELLIILMIVLYGMIASEIWIVVLLINYINQPESMLTHEIEKKNLVFRIIEYGLKHPKFTVNALQKDLDLNKFEFLFLKNNLFSIGGNQNPNHIIATERDYFKESQKHIANPLDRIDLNDYDCRLLPTAIFSYVDWLEIKEARKSATTSKFLAILAIAISIAIPMVQDYLEHLKSLTP